MTIRQGASCPKPLFQLLYPSLERRHVVLQLLQAPLQYFALHLLISQHILNPPESLEDRMILVLYPLQPTVEVIEMPEDFPEPLIMLG